MQHNYSTIIGRNEFSTNEKIRHVECSFFGLGTLGLGYKFFIINGIASTLYFVKFEEKMPKYADEVFKKKMLGIQITHQGKHTRVGLVKRIQTLKKIG